MGWFSSEPDSAAAGGNLSLASAGTEDFDSAANYTMGMDRSGTLATAGSIALAPLDLADTVVSSLVPGVNRGDINHAAINAIGGPGLMDFYNQNKGGIELASGIGGVVASSFAAGWLLKGGGAAMSAIRSVPYVGRVAALDAEYNTALNVLKFAQKTSASRGLIGTEQFAATMRIDALGGSFDLSIPAAKNAVFGRAVLKGAANNIVTEGIMTAALHTNNFLYSDDYAENIKNGLIGIVGGAAFDRAAAGFAVRKIANTDKYSRLFQKSYDPSGMEADRIGAQAVYLKEAGINPQSLGYGNGYITDRITNMALNAAELGNRPGDSVAQRVLGQNRQSFATPQLQLMHEEVQKLTTKSIPGVSEGRFSTSSPNHGRPLLQSLQIDPTFLHGVEFIAGASENLPVSSLIRKYESTVGADLDRVQAALTPKGPNGELGKIIQVPRKVDGKQVMVEKFVQYKPEELEAFRDSYKRGVFNNTLTPQVMIEAGEWAPREMGELIENYTVPKVKNVGESTEEGLWQVMDDASEGYDPIAVTHQGQVYLPGNKPIHQTDFFNALRAFHAGKAAITDLARSGKQLIIGDKANWFALDMAEHLIRQTGREDAVQWVGTLNREDAMKESLAQKVDILQAKRTGVGGLDPVDAMKLRIQLNLPRLSSYQAGILGDAETPIDVLTQGFKSGAEVRGMSLGEIRQGLQQVRKVKGLTDQIDNVGDDLIGNTFNFMLDRDGQQIKPIVGFKRPWAPFQWSQDHLADRLAVEKINTLKDLTGPDAAPFTQKMALSITGNSDFVLASDVGKLSDSQIQSAVPGFSNAAPQTARSGLMNAMLPREFIHRDNPIFLAASRVSEMASRLGRGMMREILEPAIQEVNTTLNGPRSAGSKILVNKFFTARKGWKLIEESKGGVKVGAGQDGKAMTSFVLDHNNVDNQRRFLQTFGKELEEGQLLQDSRGVPIQLDDLGMRALRGTNQVYDSILSEKNTLLRAMNLPEIAREEFYVPPPSTKGKYIGFTMDAMDNVVPGGTIVASTPEEFAKAKAALENDPLSVLRKDKGHVFRTRDEITRFMDVWDKAQMDWVSPSTTAIQPGKKALGNTVGSDINPTAWDDAVTFMRDSYMQHSRDVMGQLFKDQLNAAKARSTVSGLMQPAGVGKQAVKGRSIYDMYAETIRGTSANAAQDSFFGEGYNFIEKRANQFIREATPSVAATYSALKDFIARGPLKSNGSDELFNKLSKELGPQMPYANAAEMVERQTGAARPSDLAKIMGKFSWFEAASRLRWFESMHAVMNGAGIINTMPSVIRSFEALPGETKADYIQRIGHLAHVIETPDGKLFGMADMAKIAYRGMKKSWSKEAHPYYDYMVSRGLLGQEVAEFHRQFGAIESKEGWKGFMFGNASAQAPEKAGIFSKASTKIAQSGGLDKWLGIISDKSEDMTRTWAVMSGLEVADHLGIRGMENSVAFAHDFANKVIANYDPLNRPAVFQGAVGAPFGLFQTYIMNFYQRMFRYIETKNHAALGTQLASQGALFGISTVPGYNLAASMFLDKNAADGDGYDSIYHRFGHEAGDLIMNGAVSNIPKLFGQDGVSLYTRGDTEVRAPGLSVPVVDTAKRIFSAIGAGAGLFSSSNPNVTTQQVAEILSNMVTNRPLGGAIETFLGGGYDTDGAGQVVSKSHGFMESMWRVLGIRSESQQKELTAFYENKNAMSQQDAKITSLRMATRASIRAEDYDALPGLFAKHVEQGGDPRYYTRWVKQAYQTAVSTRGQRQLDEVLGNPNKMAYVGRLLDSQSPIDANDEDYGQAAEASQKFSDSMKVLPDLPAGASDPALREQASQMIESNQLYQQSQ